jgi:hypothetical protein
MYNLRDAAAQFDPSGQELAIAEVLSQTNEIIGDMPFIESNLDDGHEYAVRTGIPTGAWRKAYEGVPAEKGTTEVVIARPGVIGGYSVVDKLIAEKGGHVDAVRSGQAKAIVAGLSNSVADALIHGSKAELKKCVGLAEYYNHKSTSNAASARNVVHGGSSTASVNSSIYLVVWDTDKVFGFYPKGSKAGISRVDHGLVNHTDANGNEFPAYKEYFEWKVGLAVQDWRFAGRICNIKTTDLDNVNLYALMQELEERIQSLASGKPVFYMNRTIKSALRKQLGAKANVQYTPGQPGQLPIMHVDEIPVHICDAITDTEAVVGN